MPLYGREVRIGKRLVATDPPLGALGHVLTKAEHGIKSHMGWTEMTPNYPGIRGFHYLVRLSCRKKPLMLNRDMFELA